MAIIDSGGVADPASIAALPANDAGFRWKHAFAAHMDREIEGVENMLQSAEATGLLGRGHG